MNSDNILDKLNYHRNINKSCNNIDTFLIAAGYKRSSQQLDKLNYHTSITQPSLIEKLSTLQ